MTQPAEPGSLRPDALEDVRRLRELCQAREMALANFLKRRRPLTLSQTALLRTAVIAWGEGRPLHVAALTRECLHYASAQTIRSELRVLEDWGMVLLMPARGNGKIVVPSTDLVAFYNRTMPPLREGMIEKLLSATET